MIKIFVIQVIMSLQNNISDLLSHLYEAEKVYATAKANLVDLQRKLHGIPYKYQNDIVHDIAVKRGRGRPKKNKTVIEVIATNNSSSSTIDDAFSSAETVESDRDSEHDFKDARYAFMNENIYIETKYGNYHDIKTRELRGWYNPYLSRHEWL